MSDMDQKPGDELSQDIEAMATPSTGLMARFRNYFLTGLIVAGPLTVTVWLIWSFINWVDALVQPFIPPHYRPESYLPWPVPGTGLIIAIIALTLLGFLTANLIGRTLIELGEGMLSRMPIVRPIYKTMKQIFEALFSKSGSSFRQVALVEFPAPGMWSLVFISQPPSDDFAAKLPQGDHVSCFLPCTPNPTTGFFFYVKRSDLVEIDMSVENAMTLLISAGMVQPDKDKDAQKKLSALADIARVAKDAREEAPVR